MFYNLFDRAANYFVYSYAHKLFLVSNCSHLIIFPRVLYYFCLFVKVYKGVEYYLMKNNESVIQIINRFYWVSIKFLSPFCHWYSHYCLKTLHFFFLFCAIPSALVCWYITVVLFTFKNFQVAFHWHNYTENNKQTSISENSGSGAEIRPVRLEPTLDFV